MTQIGEAVLIAMLTKDEKDGKCEFQPDQKQWKANLDGDAARLGRNMGNEPKNASKEADLSASCWPSQAHHLIPHLTLKNHNVASWLKKGDVLYGDTHYDVDHRNNGKWMPYASSLAEWRVNASSPAQVAHNRSLMFKVMQLAQIQMHQGRHSGSDNYGVGECPYKECVKKYLDKIENHAISHYTKKPACTDCEGKQEAGKLPPRNNMVRYVDKASDLLEQDINCCRIFVSKIAADFKQAGGFGV
ncbi:hypothetical protein GRF61_18785 [Azoarcus sp. TTM-91]|uniref:AHH domain-containing protein n=1 Tax=Azoarcus sp. TTM-91 TaxID=2691581 RepID=UPI00145EB39D|nr:AHH domain-containing protein [Azoarcus sp. TTM-91]NMG36499.1 hypothetical protein [Azoarcus sp. TTM-91]